MAPIFLQLLPSHYPFPTAKYLRVFIRSSFSHFSHHCVLRFTTTPESKGPFAIRIQPQGDSFLLETLSSPGFPEIHLAASFFLTLFLPPPSLILPLLHVKLRISSDAGTSPVTPPSIRGWF